MFRSQSKSFRKLEVIEVSSWVAMTKSFIYNSLILKYCPECKIRITLNDWQAGCYRLRAAVEFSQRNRRTTNQKLN